VLKSSAIVVVVMVVVVVADCEVQGFGVVVASSSSGRSLV
jgi:hypothetical protein